METLPTESENEAWGFFGTINPHKDYLGVQTPAFYALAQRKIAAAVIETPDAETMAAVRRFQDSRRGRNFADDVLNAHVIGKSPEAAIDAAIKRWQGWTANSVGLRKGEYDEEVVGLPMLTAYIMQHEHDLSMEADDAE